MAFSVLWELDAEANILSGKTRFCKSSIHSRAGMTYAEAQALLDNPGDTTDIAMSIKLLNSVARKLRCVKPLLLSRPVPISPVPPVSFCRKRRIDAGALTLASAEVRFLLDSETHDPLDVAAYQMRDTNEMVRHLFRPVS